MKGFTIKLTKVEFIEKQIALGVEGLSDLHVSVMAYMYLYPINYASKLVFDKKTKNKKSVENVVTYFRKVGFVEGKGKETKLSENIKLFDVDEFAVVYVKD